MQLAFRIHGFAAHPLGWCALIGGANLYGFAPVNKKLTIDPTIVKAPVFGFHAVGTD